MTAWLAIAGGGALSAMMRFGLGRWLQGAAGLGFPVGTLEVNVLGSLFMGFLYAWLLECGHVVTWPARANLED